MDSVKCQSYPADFEVIVINDGSTDDSRDLVERYIRDNPNMDITLINQSNKGVSNARNRGLNIAKGIYIALLDADDEWLPNKIEKQMKYIRNEGIDLLASERNHHKMKYPYSADYQGLARVTLQKLLIRNEIATTTVIFKRKILTAGLFFDDQQRYAEDVNYWMRISLNFNLFILAETLVITGGGKRSFGVSGLSANLSEMAKGFQKNLYDLYQLKALSLVQLIFYSLFYRVKYFILLFRNFLYQLNN